jgi:hypothetical protein
MKHSWLPSLSRTVAAALAICAVAETAKADLKVCNCSGIDVIFETTKRADHCGESDPFDATGWFFVAHGQCSTVITGDMTGQRFHWTAASGGPTWGSTDPAETWYVPNFGHTNFCDSFIPSVCASPGNSCRISPHFAVSSTTRDLEIDIRPNNSFVTNLFFNCAHGRNDCVAVQCR